MKSRKYDDVDWHSGGVYPEGLPAENAGFHIGYFVKWAARRGLLEVSDRDHVAVDALCRGEASGSKFLMEEMDGFLSPDDLTDEGRRFADCYYDKYYADDLSQAMPRGVASFYEVPESIEQAEAVERLLDQRMQEWKEGRVFSVVRNRPWWAFWR